jgi:DNA adenine methylase
MTAPARPVLRYHGGKWRMAAFIIAHFPPHRVYVEPFGGAASVLMQKARCYAEVYNDLHADVVSLFRLLRDPAQSCELARLLSLTPYSRAEFDAAYEPCPDALESARRFVVRCFMGFGTSGTRDNKTGFRARPFRQGNDATAVHDWQTYPPALAAVSERLRGVLIEHRPALDVITAHDTPETLYYLDPPYVTATRSSLRGGSTPYAHEMTDADHVALAERLHVLEGMAVLSGYDCPLYRELYASWRMVKRPVAAQGHTGSIERTECLWISPHAQAASQGVRNLLVEGM